MFKELSVLVLLAAIVVIIAGVVWMQYKYESYIGDQVTHFGILKDKQRLSKKPAIWHYLQFELFETDSISSDAARLLYTEELFETTARIPQIDKYILACYYPEEEVNDFLSARQMRLDAEDSLSQAYGNCPMAMELKNALRDFQETDLLEKKVWLLEQMAGMYDQSRDSLEEKCGFIWDQDWYGTGRLETHFQEVDKVNAQDKNFNGFEYLISIRYAYDGHEDVIADLDRALAVMAFASPKKFLGFIDGVQEQTERAEFLSIPDWTAIDTEEMSKLVVKSKNKEQIQKFL